MSAKEKPSKSKSAKRTKKQLGYEKCLDIVVQAVKDRSKLSTEIRKQSRLGELLPGKDLPALRFDLQKHIKSHGFSFSPARISIDPRKTIADLAESISGLAGDTTTDD